MLEVVASPTSASASTPVGIAKAGAITVPTSASADTPVVAASINILTVMDPTSASISCSGATAIVVLPSPEIEYGPIVKVPT